MTQRLSVRWPAPVAEAATVRTGQRLSLDLDFADFLGFTHGDLRAMLAHQEFINDFIPCAYEDVCEAV